MPENSHAAAIVGSFARESQAEIAADEWRNSIGTLTSRHNGPLLEGRWGGGRWALRGECTCCAASEQLLEFLDGWIEKLNELSMHSETGQA